MTVVYTDGACRGNPGPGGWAWVVADGPYESGAEDDTTNQRMEITAACEAVSALRGPIEVVSDSTYVVKTFNDRWWEGWIERGWRNAKKQPVANRDLWEPFVDLVRDRGDVTFRWVKGHGGDPWNDVADALATRAAGAQHGVAGDRFDAAVLTDADDASESADAEAHYVVVAGHRPPEIGGYGPNALADRIRSRIATVLEAKAEVFDELTVLTGLGLGAEQLGAEAAIEARLPFVAVLPFPDPETMWPESSQRHFAELRSKASSEAVVAAKNPRSRLEAGRALGRRDEWLAEHGAEAILVWDGKEENVGRLHQRFDRAFDGDVWVVEP